MKAVSASLRVVFVGVFIMRALPFEVRVRADDFWGNSCTCARVWEVELLTFWP